MNSRYDCLTQFYFCFLAPVNKLLGININKANIYLILVVQAKLHFNIHYLLNLHRNYWVDPIITTLSQISGNSPNPRSGLENQVYLTPKSRLLTTAPYSPFLLHVDHFSPDQDSVKMN